MTTARLTDVVAALDARYDPRAAEDWDAVGTVCGDPDQPVRRILFAVDPAPAVVDEAIDRGVDLLVTHHPLLLRAVHSVAATTPAGRTVHRLIRAGVALHVAHTNADSANPGVSDALGRAVGLHDLWPLVPQDGEARDKVVVFVPAEQADAVLDAMAAAGAGVIGDYTRCAWRTLGEGTFVGGDASNPTVGQRGRVEVVPEVRLEVVVPRVQRAAVVRAMLAAHPYEEPAYDVYERALLPGDTGLGRIGELARAETLAEFAARVAEGLPATAGGVRVSGDPDRPVRRVAVCGGSGGSLLPEVQRAGVDAFVTADLRHHPASDNRDAGGPALLDAAHWATEWPWLLDAARGLTERLAHDGTTVECTVSRLCTDPWQFATPSEGSTTR